MATLFRDYFLFASNRHGPLASVQRRLPNLESASSSFFLTRRMESEQTAEDIQDGANSDARIQGFHYSDS